MSAFVPHYQHDVFISYARVDDEPLLPGDENSCWVRTLKQALQTLLNQRAKGANIWMDIADIACNRQLSSEISAGLAGSATLLVIMSNGYLESEWCRKELAAFVDAYGPATGNGRIFVVHRDEIPFDRWPPQLRELYGYPFYVKDAHTGLAMPLAVPKPDPQEKEYFARLHRLRDQLANQLRKMQADESESTTAPVLPDNQPLPGYKPASAPENGEATTVFLAEVTGDLYEYREQLRCYLTQNGYRVLPTQFYSRAPASFQEELDCDLRQAILFVQLLGPYPSPRTANLPLGYEGLQSTRAEAAELPVLQWRSPSLETTSVRDGQHRDMVFADSVLATDLEEFKRIVGDRLRKAVVQTDRPASTGESYILLNVAEKDLAIADAIADRLADCDVAFDIVDESTPLADLTESDDYDGLMVVYGECPQRWVQQQVRQCRRIVLDKKHRAPECAIFVGPPHDKAPLRCRPPRFHVIDEHDQAQLDAYLEALRQRRSNA